MDIEIANATRNRASQAHAKSGYCLGEIQKPFTNVPRWNGGRSAGSSFGSLEDEHERDDQQEEQDRDPVGAEGQTQHHERHQRDPQHDAQRLRQTRSPTRRRVVPPGPGPGWWR